MGSAALLDSTVTDSQGAVDSSETKSKKRKEKSAVPKSKDSTTGQKENKRNLSQGCDQPDGSRKRPKRAAACTDFKEKSVRISEKSFLVESKKDQFADEELAAIGLTARQDDGRPNRRLSEFILHNEDGVPQPLEMLEIDDLFISGLILPLEESSDRDKVKPIRCEGFGRIESWTISGYEDGSPVIWLSTDIADYDCRKPASSYKKYYELFFEKARACVEVYKKLSKASGGNSDCSLDELLAGVVRSISGSKCFCSGASIKDFIISQGEFIYNQLIGLDEASNNSDQKFTGLPVLVVLRDESSKCENFMQAKGTSLDGTLAIGPQLGDKESKMDQSGALTEEDDDTKLARLLQEEEFWQSKKQKKTRGSASGSNKFYIKINEDEIANDYPLPAYYKSFDEETDELVVCDEYFGVCDIDDLPRSMLHNWSLYNSDSRLISLELLPMKPCADIDVTIYGSGNMTDDDGSGFCLDSDPNQSSTEGAVSGFPIFLSAIKEWMIEFGSSMIFISIRTDAAW